MSPLVLIVEDDRSISELLLQFLEWEGYRVATASNGREALDFLRTHAVKPNAILLDLRMPILSGEDFLAVRRRDTQLKNIPVLLMSAEKELELEDFEIAARIPKPLDINHLLAELKAIVAPGSTIYCSRQVHEN